MTAEREAVVRHRLERARETLAEAELLAQSGHWNGCVNRLYYSCFYAATALLLHHDMSSSKHSGVLSLFNRHFVKTGVVPDDLGEFFNTLFQARNRGDYDDLARFDKTRVVPWVGEAERLLEKIEELVPLN